MPEHAAHIADDRVVPATKQGDRLPSKLDRSKEIDFHDPSHPIGSRLGKRSDRTDACIVDEQIKLALTQGASRPNRFAADLRVRDITGNRNQLARPLELAGKLLETLAAASNRNDLRAATDQQLTQAASDPAARTGHQGDRVFRLPTRHGSTS